MHSLAREHSSIQMITDILQLYVWAEIKYALKIWAESKIKT